MSSSSSTVQRLVLLAVCVVGIYAAYLKQGLLQEQLYGEENFMI